MLRLSVSEIVDKITKGIPFEAVLDDYSFTLKIDAYVPFICAAVHDGHQFRKSLWKHCIHTGYERWYEEDPATKQMVQSQPIVIAGRDSRFEYDLNRHSTTAIYEDAWGKKLWKNPLSEHERRISLEKHRNFYTVIDSLINKIESIYGTAIVFDMHSYNWKRWDREVPTWNLGTSNIDNQRFGAIVDSWSAKLGEIQLPYQIKSTSKINDTFQGNGYFLKHITQKFRNTLVLATEISKIYCDELTGLIYPEIVLAVEEQLKQLIPLQAKEFQENI